MQLRPPNLDRMRKVNRNDTMPTCALRISVDVESAIEAWKQLGTPIPWATGDPHRP